MVLSSSCSCLFSQNSSVLLTKSCVRMPVYPRQRERERLCPYVTRFAHKLSTSIFPFLNMSDLNMKTGNFFITQPPCAHMATKLMVNVKVEWKGQGVAKNYIRWIKATLCSQTWITVWSFRINRGSLILKKKLLVTNTSHMLTDTLLKYFYHIFVC